MGRRWLWGSLAVGGVYAAWRAGRRPTPVDRRGRVVIITGAASDIGRAAAQALAAEGATVVLADRCADALAAVRDELAASDAPVLAAPTDLSRDADVDALVKVALAAGGRIDILVNCAALDLGGLLPESDPARLRAIVSGDLYGTIRLTQAVLPVMRQQEPARPGWAGHIINVGSLAGLVGTPGRSVTSASRAALAGFTAALRREVTGDGLRVTLVLLGLNPTPAIAAAAIVAAARYGRQTVIAGGWPLRLVLWAERLAPPLVDRYWRWAVTPAYYESVRRLGE